MRYSLSLFQIVFNDNTITDSNCSCTIGQSGHCGHVTALLYQLAHYKQMNLKVVPSDLAKTSMPQTWHLPRGEKLHGSKADQTVVQGYDRDNLQRATRGIKSTLYNPLPADHIYDVNSFVEQFQDMGILFNTVMENTASELVQTDFGKFPKGSVLNYQQTTPSEYVLNLVDLDTFPDLPSRNAMTNDVCIVLNEEQIKLFDSLRITDLQCKEIEENTRLQSSDPKWHKIRSQRITASNAGEIAKRRAGNNY